MVLTSLFPKRDLIVIERLFKSVLVTGDNARELQISELEQGFQILDCGRAMDMIKIDIHALEDFYLLVIGGGIPIPHSVISKNIIEHLAVGPVFFAIE